MDCAAAAVRICTSLIAPRCFRGRCCVWSAAACLCCHAFALPLRAASMPLPPLVHLPSTLQIDKASLKPGSRVILDPQTLTVMRKLPREVDPTVFQMLSEDPGDVTFNSIGGLNEEIRELREAIELPLTNPELFKRVGIKPPKGVLLYGPPGTGKTLIARALAATMNASFLKVSGPRSTRWLQGSSFPFMPIADCLVRIDHDPVFPVLMRFRRYDCACYGS